MMKDKSKYKYAVASMQGSLQLIESSLKQSKL